MIMKVTDSESYCMKRDSQIENGMSHWSFVENHYLNLKEEEKRDLEKIKIYKFIPMDKLKILLCNSALYMDRVSCWEDPYENYFLKEHFLIQLDGKWMRLGVDSVIPVLFGQSWTTSPETDALWRIYSPCKNAIRIETTARKLLEAVYISDKSMASVWIGKVDYSKTLEQLNKEACAICENDSYEIWRDYLPRTLFNKRPEFKHENEFRVIQMFETGAEEYLNKYQRISYEIYDMDDFILSYRLDPRLNNDEYDNNVRELEQLGVPSAKIKKSLLYDFNPITIKIGSMK